MSILHSRDLSRLNYLPVLILLLPLMACNGGGGGSGSPGSGGSGSPGLNEPYLSWLAPSEREDGTGLSLTEIAGYRVYYGENSGEYTNFIDIHDRTMVQMALASIPSGTYYVAVTAIDTEGRESALSSEIVVNH